MTKTMTPKKALAQYEQSILLRQNPERTFATDALIVEKQKKIEEYLMSCNEIVADISEVVHNYNPFLAWTLSDKSDGATIEAYMAVSKSNLPQLEATIEHDVKVYKSQLETLEAHALKRLIDSGLTSMKVGEVGRMERRTSAKYSVADKNLFVADAVKNEYVAELTISVRPNSKLMAQIREERKELPPGVSVFEEVKAVFVKN